MNNTVITKDVASKKLHVTHEFAAALEKVWRAWTESSILDKWWAPKPWKAVTKVLDLKPGGMWLYSMVGPNGEVHWSRVDFKTVQPQQSFSTVCVFSDENGNPNPDIAPMYWLVKFEAAGPSTKVIVELTFDEESDMQKMVEMGFEGGFTMGLGNLDELLAQ
jgi:uncharacterized protein YndB with AHSA1/START domain